MESPIDSARGAEREKSPDDGEDGCPDVGVVVVGVREVGGGRVPYLHGAS